MSRFLIIGFIATVFNISATASEDCMGADNLEHCQTLVKDELERCLASNIATECYEAAQKGAMKCEESCPDMMQYKPCLGMDSLEACHKLVAKEFQDCSSTVVYGGMVRNDEGLNKCKESAKRKKEVCKVSCPKMTMRSAGHGLN